MFHSMNTPDDITDPAFIKTLHSAYVQSYRLFGPSFLHLVVHHCIVDAKTTENNKGLCQIQ